MLNFKPGYFWSWLAEISYPLYLSHLLAFLVVDLVFKRLGFVHEYVAVAISILTSFWLATLLHHGVEKPFLRLRDKLLHNPRLTPGGGR